MRVDVGGGRLLLPNELWFRGVGEILPEKEYLDGEAARLRDKLDQLRAAAARYRLFRNEAAGELHRLGEHELGRRIANCREIWLGGAPFTCGRTHFCPSCLEYRLYVVGRDDIERLRGRAHGVLVLTVDAPVQHLRAPNWYAHVRGYRKLWLPKTKTYLWIVDSDHDNLVEKFLGRRPRRVALGALREIYQRALIELVNLGPKAAITHARALPPKFHVIDGTGSFRRPLPPRRPRRPATRITR